VFLGYRVASYGDLVNCLYDKLKAEGVNVWWDKRCLTAGQPCEQGFADGLCSCDVFVKAGLARLAYLTATSACDNVLIEHQLALGLQLCGDLRVISTRQQHSAAAWCCAHSQGYAGRYHQQSRRRAAEHVL